MTNNTVGKTTNHCKILLRLFNVIYKRKKPQQHLYTRAVGYIEPNMLSSLQIALSEFRVLIKCVKTRSKCGLRIVAVLQNLTSYIDLARVVEGDGLHFNCRSHWRFFHPKAGASTFHCVLLVKVN